MGLTTNAFTHLSQHRHGRGFQARFSQLLTIVVGLWMVACGGGSGAGGAVALPCGPGGACQPGTVCVNNYCIFAGNDTQGSTGQDAAAGQDGVGSQDTASGSDGSLAPDAGDKPDAPPTGHDALADGSQDVIPVQDVQTVDTPTPPPDVPPADVGPTAATIYGLQSAASSLTCEKSDGTQSYGKVALEAGVVTAPPVTLSGTGGKKFQTLFVAPATGPLSPAYAGIQIVIQPAGATLEAGDVIQVTGEVIEFYCMTEVTVTPEQVQVIGKVAPPKAYDVPMNQLGPDVAEALEGVLLRVSNVTVTNPNLMGQDGKLHGEFLVSAGGVDLAVGLQQQSQWLGKDQSTKLQAGDQLQSVTGHLTWSFGKWLLRLRNDADLVP